MAYPSVAVIIPTYNRATLLAEAIESLLTQTHLPDEIIIIDDGSTDNTQAVLNKYSSSIQVITQANQGRSSARNAGLKAVRSDLVTMLDSDDILLPASIEKRWKLFKDDPALNIVYSDVALADRQGTIKGVFSGEKPQPRPSGMIFSILAQDNFLPIHAVMFRRACLEQTGLFDVTLHAMEDYDFWLRMAAHYPFIYLPSEPLAVYLDQGEMMSSEYQSRLRYAGATVQERAVVLPVFAELSPREQAKILVALATRYIALGNVKRARQWLVQAIKVGSAPVSVYGYLAITLIGSRGMIELSNLRRKLVRKVHLGSRAT
jgi:glycosyltransferase involved in cell wall biosynthesis